MEQSKVTIAHRLRKARADKNYSQNILAMKSAVSLRCIQKVEARHVLPDLYTLHKLGHVLGIAPEDFFRA